METVGGRGLVSVVVKSQRVGHFEEDGGLVRGRLLSEDAAWGAGPEATGVWRPCLGPGELSRWQWQQREQQQ